MHTKVPHCRTRILHAVKHTDAGLRTVQAIGHADADKTELRVMRSKRIHARWRTARPTTAVNDEVAGTFIAQLEACWLKDVQLQLTLGGFLVNDDFRWLQILRQRVHGIGSLGFGGGLAYAGVVITL